MGTAVANAIETILVSVSREGLVEALGGKRLSEIIEFNILRWAFIRSKIFRNIPAPMLPKILQIAEIREYNDNEIIMKKK